MVPVFVEIHDIEPGRDDAARDIMDKALYYCPR
jgi:hypothetical protein